MRVNHVAARFFASTAAGRLTTMGSTNATRRIRGPSFLFADEGIGSVEMITGMHTLLDVGYGSMGLHQSLN